MPNNFAQEAQEIVRRNPEGVYYYKKFGNPIEKAIAEVFLEAAVEKSEYAMAAEKI